MKQINVRLISIRFAARDTNFYEFAPLDGAALPASEAGAHIDVFLPNGITRQYSLTSPDHSPASYVIGVKRDIASRGGSRYIFDNLRVGQNLAISPPRNNFKLEESAPSFVLFAGGIGITPIWAMAQRLQEIGKPWELHYSTRSRVDAAYTEQMRHFSEVKLHFNDENEGRLMDISAAVASAPSGAHFYCCGPVPMLDAFGAATADLTAERKHVEYFSPVAEISHEGGFIVELARSGKSFTVPQGKTILDTLRDAGIEATHSCEQGVCGACEVAVLSGAPDHRDSVLSESERESNKTMMICCSGCLGARLVLDM